MRRGVRKASAESSGKSRPTKSRVVVSPEEWQRPKSRSAEPTNKMRRLEHVSRVKKRGRVVAGIKKGKNGIENTAQRKSYTTPPKKKNHLNSAGAANRKKKQNLTRGLEVETQSNQRGRKDQKK